MPRGDSIIYTFNVPPQTSGQGLCESHNVISIEYNQELLGKNFKKLGSRCTAKLD